MNIVFHNSATKIFVRVKPLIEFIRIMNVHCAQCTTETFKELSGRSGTSIPKGAVIIYGLEIVSM